MEHLAEQGLEMGFPGRTLYSHADFQDWYREIGKSIRANIHDIYGLQVAPTGKDLFKVDLFVWWRAITNDGKTLSQRIRQNWEVESRNGKFLMRRLMAEVQ